MENTDHTLLPEPRRCIYWSTLDFSETSFNGNKQEFISIVNKTLKQYRDRRLLVDEFRLRISLGDSYRESVSLIEKWVPLITAMGVKVFRLSILSQNIPGLIHLPSVVFEAESLHDLYVERLVLDQKAVDGMVPFTQLRSLRLHRVCVEEGVFRKIIASCPLVEVLHLHGCTYLRNINLNNLHNLTEFFFSARNAAEEICGIEIDPPSLETINLSYGNIWFHDGAEFRSLQHLNIEGVTSSLDRLLSCKFPSLKTLGIIGCEGLKYSSRVFIDAPNMAYFKYEGDFFPSISFATIFGDWDSAIHLRYPGLNDASSWFLQLKNMLDSLRQSRISLSVSQSPMNEEVVIQQNINLVLGNGCNGKPVTVESLSLQCGLSSFSSLLNGAFSICRPRNIGDYGYRWEIKRIERLWKILMMGEYCGEGDRFSQLWFRDLEDVGMEIYENYRKEWRSITLSELLRYPQRDYVLTRFALKWR